MPFALPVARMTRGRQRLRDEHHLLGVLLESVEVAPVACAVDERGRCRGALAVFEDVTEQRAREAQMRARLRASGPSGPTAAP